MAKAALESNSVSFGRAIRERRHALDISQEELAARSGLHRTYLADLERGNRNPSLESIHAVANGLGIQVSELFRHVERLRKSGRVADGRKRS
jgi:transcriptional regulator with XRE-family HTH domain